MINVLFFAGLQEAVGKEKLVIEADGITVKELKADFLTKYSVGNFEYAMTAINEEFAADDSVVHSGDIVAFIPPVSGG